MPGWGQGEFSELNLKKIKINRKIKIKIKTKITGISFPFYFFSSILFFLGVPVMVRWKDKKKSR